MEANAPAGSPPSGDSALARIPGVFVSPGKTFEAIARRPTWLLPMILWVIASISVSVVLLPRMDFEKMTRDRIEKSGRTIPEDQIQSMVERSRQFAPVFAYGGSVVAPFGIALLTAVILWGAFRAFGWDTTFSQSFGATVHAFLPSVLGSILLIALLSRQERVDPSAMGDLLRSNLGFLVPLDNKVLHALLSSIDLFSFWTLALLVIGFSASAKIRKGPAAGVILALWGLYVLGKAGLAAVF